MRTLAFTGHRPPAVGGYNEDNQIKRRVSARLQIVIQRSIDKGFTRFISGMALGVDIWAAEAVIEVKKSNPLIQLIAAVPMALQHSKWKSKSDIDRWHAMLKLADEIYVTNGECGSIDEPITYDALYQKISPMIEAKEVVAFYDALRWLDRRNKWMVDRCDALFGVYNDEEGGGTYNCLEYAKKKNVKTAVYNPFTNVTRCYFAPVSVEESSK